jgi:hypothetical protein
VRFYTKEESESYTEGRGMELTRSSPASVTAWYPPNPARLDLRWIAHSITCGEPIMLWITEWGIWPSSENWHLYYRLRQSYGDQRLLHEAPGHLLLDYERDDLASFLQIAITNGWGGYIASSSADSWYAFFSHDEYIEFHANEDVHLADVKKHYEDLLKPPSEFHSEGGRQRISADGAQLSPEEVHPKP